MAVFKLGEEVEVSLPGGLFPAKITDSSLRDGIAVVEYQSAKKRKRSEVKWSAVRPPLESLSDDLFSMGDEVDALFGGCWREGIVARIKAGPIFTVRLRDSNHRLDCKSSHLRLHREWLHGRWVPPLPPNHHKENKPLPSKSWKTRFSKGTLVEVMSDEEGFRGSFYAATILKAIPGDKYVVEYKSLRTKTDKEFVRQRFEEQRIRPFPPEALVVDGFNVDEKVDALYNDGWWEGFISKVLHQGRYRVYFEDYEDKEMVFDHSDLRPHQDWINGAWVMPYF